MNPYHDVASSVRCALGCNLKAAHVTQRAYLAKRLREVGIEVSWRGQPDSGGAEQVDSQLQIQTAEHRAAVAEALNSWRGADGNTYTLLLG